MTRVLVVDDDPQILRALRITLTANGYRVDTARSGSAALRAAAEGHPDAVVLDLGLPDLDGTEVIGRLRGWTSVPIIVLSARTDSPDKVHALDAGADDYVTKPFGTAELLARLRAAVRRSTTTPTDGEPVIDAGDFVVDLAAKRIRRDGVDVHLTPTSGRSSRPSSAAAANWSAGAGCCRRSGVPHTAPRTTTCGSTSPSYAASWNPSPPGPDT